MDTRAGDEMSSDVHIIAEAGTNHNGRTEVAERLIDVAAGAGADSVKFQIIFPDGLYLPKVYVEGRLTDNAVFQKRLAGMLPNGAFARLADHCRARGIRLSASVFDVRGIDLLCALDAPYLKIASCDLNNSRLLVQAAERGKRLVISTGMATLGEIERAVADVTAAGAEDIVLMHCVSEYPCPTERMNLGFIRTLSAAFGLPVGLSDHTESSLAAAAAVAMGVTWIEKHFTLDRSAEGFDHAYAMEPTGLEQYVRDVRAVSRACVPRPAKVGPGEAHVRTRARRSLYARRALDEGQMVTEADVLVVRPEGPLAPNDIDRVLGRVVRRPISQYEPLSLDMFS